MNKIIQFFFLDKLTFKSDTFRYAVLLCIGWTAFSILLGLSSMFHQLENSIKGSYALIEGAKIFLLFLFSGFGVGLVLLRLTLKFLPK